MQKYRLTYNDLLILCQLNFNSDLTKLGYTFHRNYRNPKEDGIWSDAENFVQTHKTYWNFKFFDLLLQNQPELNPLVKEFWDKCKNHENIDSLAAFVFRDKIYIKSITPMIFECVSAYMGYHEHKSFIKRLIKQETSVMNDLHQKLLNKPLDSLLHAYIELLPSLCKEIKDTKENIWKILSLAKNYSEAKQIKLLDIIVKTFPHDKQSYEFLKEYFGPKLDINHNLREKFHQHENKYFSKFKEKTNAELFSTTEEFRATFGIKDCTLIDNFGIPKEVASKFNSCLSRALESLFTKNIGNHLFFNYSFRGMEISSHNLDDGDKIKEFIHFLKSELGNVLLALNETVKKEPDEALIEKHIESALLYNKLQGNLSKTSKDKVVRKKI